VGSGAPSIVAGDEEGDLYLDTANGDVYQVQSSAWVLVANITGPAGADGADGADGVDISASYASSFGPAAADQTISASGDGSVLDLDTSAQAEPGASWNLTGAGRWDWEGGEDATFLVIVKGIYQMSGNTGILTQSLQKGASGSVSGSISSRDFADGEIATLVSHCIVDLSDGNALKARCVATYGAGATAVLLRGQGTITIVRIK
jgi:hypothetical protein